MLRTVASPGTFRCHDRRFLLTINVLRLLIRRLTPTTTCGSPSPPAPRFCSEGRKRLTSPHWQGVARAKRAQRPLLRGESSGPQITPVWPKGGLTSALPLLEKLENLEIFWGEKKKKGAKMLKKQVFLVFFFYDRSPQILGKNHTMDS